MTIKEVHHKKKIVGVRWGTVYGFGCPKDAQTPYLLRPCVSVPGYPWGSFDDCDLYDLRASNTDVTKTTKEKNTKQIIIGFLHSTNHNMNHILTSSLFMFPGPSKSLSPGEHVYLAIPWPGAGCSGKLWLLFRVESYSYLYFNELGFFSSCWYHVFPLETNITRWHCDIRWNEEEEGKDLEQYFHI